LDRLPAVAALVLGFVISDARADLVLDEGADAIAKMGLSLGELEIHGRRAARI
jgi:hypothetical protein